MAIPTRARRIWTALQVEMEERLREASASSGYWTQNNLLSWTNQAMDKRVMELAIANEGWVTSTFKTSIVANQREYTLPEGAGRVKQILWSVPDTGSSSNTRETPMVRQEGQFRITGGRSTQAGFNTIVPTYRLEGALILLEPTPEKAETNGLWIQCEYAPARLLTSGKLDIRFPDVMETMLIHDVVVTALRVESSRTGDEPSGLDDAVRERNEYQFLWAQYIEDRSSGTVSTEPYDLGD